MVSHLTGEGDGRWQFDQSNIVNDADGSPVLVDNVFGSSDLDASGLGCQSDIVRSQIDIEETGFVGAIWPF